VKKRVKTIFNNIEKDIDAILIKNSTHPFIDKNFFYVTGLEKGIFEGCTAVLHLDGNIDLIVSELEAETASKSKTNLHVYKDKKDFRSILKNTLSSKIKIGVNYKGILHRDFCEIRKWFPEKKFIDISDELIETRLVKEKQEIELIKKACEISNAVMEKIPDMLHEGICEYEIAAEIDYLMVKKGADKPAFETISSFDKNTAEPHYTHGSVKLRKGYLALFDFGACFRRYNSDITRTFVFGKANERQREMHETVLEAQKIALDAIKPGVKANEVHNMVNSYINSTKFKNRFIHSTGHSLGLEVHDGARLISGNNMELKENMVFTVEPGVYIPGTGGVRIEDDIVVKKRGVEMLTKHPRELEI
jgi:Xaa-Pro dipeptidase